MKKGVLLIVFMVSFTLVGWGQTTVFLDDFSTNKDVAWTTSGAIGASSWSVTRPGADWGARRNTTPEQLEQTNDVGGTANVAGWVYSSVPLSAFSSPYNATLSSNSGLITWTFNFRTNRTSALAGFTGTTSYGMAMVLVSTSNTPNNTGNGYAVVMGGGGTNTIALISFTNGLLGTKTTIIGFGGAPAALTNYMSVRVTYNPTGNYWELYSRDDGVSGFADPASGTLTQIGTSTANSTYTGTAMSYLGAYWQGSTSANQITFFDNVKVTLAEVITPTIQAYNITFSGISTTGMIPSWTNGDGAKRIVIMNTTNSFTSPADGTDPSADPEYGGSGEQVVYNNSSNTVTISGLTASTTYWYRVYEYNGSGANTKYLTTEGTNNPKSQETNGSSTPPTITAPAAVTITTNSAFLGGNITSDGGAAITERGTVYKTSSGVNIDDNKLAEGGTTTGTFSHNRSSLDPKTHYYYKAYATNSVGTTLTTEAEFYTLATEPAAHVTGFAAASGGTTSIDLSWTGTSSGADGYLILQRTGAAVPTGTPADATGYSAGNTLGDGTVAAIVSGGTETSKTINGLSSMTQYSFTIFPFAWDGANNATYNYYTAATIPGATATTDAPPATTYTWTGADNASWAVASNWNPERSSPANNDILQFNDGSTKTITAVPAQTIGQLLLSGNTTVNLQASGTNTLTISGGTGTDLAVPSGSALNINGTNALTITLSTGATGSIGGNMTFTVAAHKLNAADAAGIIFNSGSSLTQGTSCTGNIFTNSGNPNVVQFESGSTFEMIGLGSNPFGLSAPSSKVVFNSGSLYKHSNTNSPSFSGRTYANFEYNTSATINATGTATLIVENLTIDQGTLNFNMTATPGHSIKGNIYVASGATLNFSPASAGTVNLNGTATQSISGEGILSTNSNSTLVVNNAVIADKDITFGGNLSINADKSFTINTGKQVTVTGTLNNAAGASGLVIKSGGSLIQSSASVAATVERSVLDWGIGTAHGWHFLSSPVAAQSVSPAFISDPAANYDFYAWWEPTNQWVNYKNSSTPPTWSTANVLGATSGEGNFIPGKGYLVAYANADTKAFSGTLNTNDISVTNLSFNTEGTNYGWHLLGNPYPSALTWGTAAWSPSNVNSTAKIWKESTAAYVDIPANTGIIPPLNGFMVNVSSGTNAITIPAAARVHDATPWYKSSDSPKILLVANDPTGSTAQESVIRFEQTATTAFDPEFDCRFLPGYAPLFYSVQAEEHLSTMALPETGGNVQIPFNFIKNDASNFSIEAQSIRGIYGPVILNDLKTGTSQDLTLNPVYAFTSAAGDNPSRFLLTFSHVGIGENQKGNAFTVYAAGDQLIVVDNSGKNQGDVLVYNMMGQAIASGKLNGAAMLKLSMNVPTGYYLVKITSPQATQSSKVFVQ